MHRCKLSVVGRYVERVDCGIIIKHNQRRVYGGGGGAPPRHRKKNVKKSVRRGHPEYLKCSKTVWRPGLRPGPRWELTALPQAGCPLLKNPTPALATRGFGPRFRLPRQQILKTPLHITTVIFKLNTYKHRYDLWRHFCSSLGLVRDDDVDELHVKT